MNKNCKVLPGLHCLFLQKQSTASHNKKIQQIRQKKPQPYLLNEIHLSKSKCENTVDIHEAKHKHKHNDNSLNRHKSVANYSHHISPMQKEWNKEVQRENSRLRKRIQSSKSQLKQQYINKEHSKFDEIKKRLQKYEINPFSNKPILKCQRSLHTISPKHMKSIEKQSSLEPKMLRNFTQNVTINHLIGKNRQNENYSQLIQRTDQLKTQLQKSHSSTRPIKPMVLLPKIHNRKHKTINTEINASILNQEVTQFLSKSLKMSQANV